MTLLLRILSTCLVIATLSACGSPKSSAEYVALAKRYLAEDDRDSAVLALKNALQINKHSAKARWILGELYWENGDVLSAQKELELASKRGWPDVDVIPALAKTLIEQGKFTEVSQLDISKLEEVTQGRVISLKALAAFALGDTERAVNLIMQALLKAPSDVDVFVTQAKLLANDDDFEAAMQVLSGIFETEPENGPAWSLYAGIKLAQGELEEAREAYSKAIKFKRNAFSDRLQRGILHLQLQNVDAAEEDANHLLEISPQHPGSNYVAGRKILAAIRLQDGKYKEVVKLMELVLETDPDDVDALNLLANAHLRDGRTGQGISLLARIVELQPNSHVAKVRLGAGLLAGGQNDAAVHQIESALELNPEFQQAEILLVLNHLQKEDFEKAIAAAEAFRRRHLVSITPNNLLGQVHLRAGNPDEAIRAFERALDLDGGDPSANHSLAQIELSRGDSEAARLRYRTVLDDHTNLLPAMLALARIDALEHREVELVQRLNRAISAHPSELEPLLLLGRFYLSEGAPEKVAPLFVSLDMAQQQAPEVLQLLALSQLTSRDHEKAQFTLEQLGEGGNETAESHHLT